MQAKSFHYYNLFTWKTLVYYNHLSVAFACRSLLKMMYSSTHSVSDVWCNKIALDLYRDRKENYSNKRDHPECYLE